MTGFSLQVRAPGRPTPWPGSGGGYVPRLRRRGEVSRPAALGVLLAVLLAGGGTAAAVTAAPPAPAAVACSPAAAGGKLTPEQRANATRIIAEGRAMGAPQRAQIVAVATAMQESSLVNLDGGDRDSAGLFQQRPSQGWGSWSEVTDPGYSSRTFYSRLLALKGWERMDVTVAAQRIQRSAFPDAYAKWERPATSLVTGTTCEKT